MKGEVKSVIHPEIVSKSGQEDVAEVYVARTRKGDDTSMIEFVDGTDGFRPRVEKWIVNVSTQYGCPVGCLFCDAGHEYHGNLTSDEILGQVSGVLERHPGLASGCKKLKVHFARMGEPALNDNTLEALDGLPDLVNSTGLWACLPTIAPSGRERWFDGLFKVKERHFRGRFQLQFSINTTDMELRSRLMPARLNGLDWMADYSNRFHMSGDRKVVLNFALAEDSPFDPAEITGRFDPAKCAVKITPLNPTRAGGAGGLATASVSGDDAVLEGKVMALQEAGFDVILSVGDGREDAIGSNCGQSVRAFRIGRNVQL
jgi:23S rRNA (adenine2503-C2)-methyltransferase